MGCGIAAVAFVLGCTYKEAKELFENASQKDDGGYRQSELNKVLNDNGRPYVVRNSRTKPRDWWNELPDGAIVCVEMYPRDIYCHYLVRDGDEWVDSLSEDVTKKTDWKLPPNNTGRRLKKRPPAYRAMGKYLVPA